MNTAHDAFIAARDFLLAHRTDYDTAIRHFRWPALTQFNWALDYFDVMAADNDEPALWIVGDDASECKRSFREMSERSSQVANHLRALGVQRGDRILLMLGNEVALWETMLAAMKMADPTIMPMVISETSQVPNARISVGPEFRRSAAAGATTSSTGCEGCEVIPCQRR